MSRVLTFRVGSSTYALPADLVIEIIEDDAAIHPFPLAQGNLTGVVQVRGRWVPVVDFPQIWGEARERGAGGAAPVLMLLGRDAPRLGVQVDGVGEVTELEAQWAAKGHRSEPLVEIDGELVRYVDPSALAADHQRLLEGEGGSMPEEQASGESIQLVVFRVGPADFGVDVMKVAEVARVPELRAIPNAPDFVKGMAEVRRHVVPVIDMRKRFGLADAETGGVARLLVLSTGKGQVGFVVDEVPGVLRIPANSVSPAPEFFKGLAGRFIAGTALNENRLLVLLNAEELLDSDEEIALEQILKRLEGAAEGKAAGPAKKKTSRRGRRGKKKSDG